MITAAIALAALLSAPADAAAPPERRTAVVTAVERAAPAVVNLSAKEIVSASGDPLVEKFFEEMVAAQGRAHPGARTSLGSGVLIRADGYVVTNAHLVARGEGLQITLLDERYFPAKVVGSDPETDIAVVKIEATDLPHLDFGSTSDLMLGETVIVVGNPFGVASTVATGVVSATDHGRGTSPSGGADVIQTDASINPGNSGGALLDATGALIGITTAIRGREQDIGFALPAERARKIVDDLIAHGEVRRGYLGLEGQDLTAELASALGVEAGKGVVVRSVDAEGPAAKAGVKTGDVITSAAGRVLHGDNELAERIGVLTEGESIDLEIVRESTPQRVTVVAAALTPEHLDELGWRRLGIRVAAPKTDTGSRAGLAITKVRPRSTAAAARIEPGDRLLAIANAGTDSLDSYRRVVRSLRSAAQVQILVARGDARYQIMLPLEE